MQINLAQEIFLYYCDNFKRTPIERLFAMKKKLRKACIGGLALFGVLVAGVAFVAPVNAESSSVTRMTLVQAKPTLFTYENLPGEAPGKKTYFAAQLSKPSGQAFGLLTGNITSVHPVEGNPEEARLRTLIFRLPGGQIVAMGNSVYPKGVVEINPNTAINIAVIGGTGKYLGARGEVTSNRNADGTYTHKFTLLK
jgi:hypothetical protein